MSKLKTRTIGLIVAIALLCTAIANVLSATSFVTFAGTDESSVSPVMTDPAFKMTSFADDDLLTLMSDDTVHGVLHPTAGFGGRANASNLGDRMRYTIEDGVTVELKNVSIEKEGRFFITMQTHPTGTMGAGNGGGVHVGFDVMYYANHGKCFFHLMVYNTDTSVGWVPLEIPLDGDEWSAESIVITFTAHSVNVKYTGATTDDADMTLSDGIAGFENLCADFNDSSRQYYSPQAYLSIDCYYPNVGQTRGTVNFDLISVNGKAPGAIYREALNAQVSDFIAAVETAEQDGTESNIAGAVALNTFGTDGAYGKLLAQFGTSEQKTQVAAAVDKIVSLNGDSIFAELKGQIEAYIAALDAYDLDDESTHSAATAAYGEIDWSQYDVLNAGFKEQVDALVSTMKSKTFFKSSIYDVADKAVKSMETATSAEFSSSDGYLNIKAQCEGWADYKNLNFVNELAASKIEELDARVAAVEEKVSASFYDNFIYIGTESEVKLYDEGLYLSVKPDVYPNTDNAVSFKQKMTLGENSEISFNLIYALRKLGAFQMQIGFYPVAGAMTKGGVDGVRVDFWLSETGITEVKPVNGKDETDAYTGAILSLTDEEFFDFEADVLDYTKSDYTVKLCKNADGTLYVTVNGLEIDITGAGLNADLFKDGVYITITGCGYNGTANNELLVTKVGSTVYADVGTTETPGTETPGNDDGTQQNKGCGSVAAVSSLAVAALLFGTAVVMMNKKKD